MINTIILGNCLDKLKDIPDNSIDSIVTDPPYHLTSMSKPRYDLDDYDNGKGNPYARRQAAMKGFMGKEWDGLDKNGNGIAHNVEMWKECLRVLKPGGHLLSFGGTRTYHRMACAIEDAGFEVRDMIAWVYGCLSEDTEILTEMGYKPLHKTTQDDRIMVYDIQKNIYQWERPQGWQVYRVHEDTAYRIQSDYTDQIVSRNHNCIVERGGKLVFKKAEELSEMEYVPVLSEDFYTLQKGYGKLLLKELLWKSKGLAKTLLGKWKGKEKSQERFETGKEPSVEGWSNLFQKERKLWKIQNQVCEMSKGISADGEERWVCNGTSFDSGSIIGEMFRENPSGASYQSQSRGQQVGEPEVVSIKQRTQDTRVARVTKIKYSGLIFCPTVSTGAFVARRNGKVFITGNSGFPKSLNIGKAVDKLQGNEREVVGKKEGGAYSPGTKNKGIGQLNTEDKNDGRKTLPQRGSDFGLYTKGNSQWEGWGTALKPALEPITVARKPLSEKTVAENVLRWGTGGINIDGCRVEAKDGVPLFNKRNDLEGSSFKGGANRTGEIDNTTGRFPANLIHDGSDEVVSLFPNSGNGNGQKRVGKKGGSGFGYFDDERTKNTIGTWHNDSGSASRFFMTCKYTPNDAIMKLCENNINANNAELSLPITNLIEAVVNIYSVLKSATPNIDLLNQNLNALFAEKIPKNTVIDFVAKLVATSEVPEVLLSQQELQATQDFIINYKNSTQTQNLASAEKLENTDITQITINLLKLCGFVVLVIDENTNSDTKEKAEQKLEPKRFAYIPKASKSERNRGLDSTAIVLINFSICENNTTQEEKEAQLLVDMGILAPKDTEEYGTQAKEGSEWNTLLFGKSLMEKYQEDIKSTILTKTNSTTTLAIYNWLALLLTKEYTADVNLEMENGGSLAEDVENYNILATITNEKMVLALGAKNAQSKVQLKISVKEGKSSHPTVKPQALMKYLIKLITPPGGTVLDPFAGSGSTLVAAKDLGHNYIGIEMTEEYIPIIKARLTQNN